MVIINPVPLPPYGGRAYNHITPFTYRDGLTFVEVLEQLRAYIRDVVVPHVDDSFDNLEEYVDNAVDEITIYVTNAVDSIINSSVELQDMVLAGIVGDAETTARIVLDGLYADKSIEATLSDAVTDLAEVKTDVETRLSNAALETLIVNKTDPLFVSKLFDPARGVYNLTDAKRAKLRTMFASARAGGSLLYVAGVGDSTVAGLGSGAPGVDGWMEQMRTILTDAGYADFGEPMAMVNRSIASTLTSGSADSRLTVGAGWVPHAATSPVGENSTTTDPLTFNATTVSRRLRVLLASGSGPVTVRIDGSIIPTTAQASGLIGCTYDDVTGTLTPNASHPTIIQAAFSTPVDENTHSLSVARVSGTARVFAFDTFPVPIPSAGIRWMNLGFGSARASHLIGSGGTYPHTTYLNYLGANVASVVFLMAEINDATNGTSVATYKGQMQTEIDNLTANGAELVIVASNPINTADLTSYTVALRELAVENGVPMIDLQYLYGTWSGMDDAGLMNDGVHPSKLGYLDIAYAISRALGLV